MWNLSSLGYWPETSQFPVMMTEFFPASDLAKTDSLARLCVHEILELAEREPSIDWTLRSDGDRGDRSRDRRVAGAYARSLLGGNRDSGRNAIQSRRYADAVHRTRSRNGPGRVSRRSRGKLFRSKSCRLHA